MSSSKEDNLEVDESGRSYYYHHTNPSLTSSSQGPEIGDAIISFKVVHASTISIIAYFDGNDLDEYTTDGDRPFILVVQGEVPARIMLQDARDANTLTAWIIRFGAYFVNILGICLILQPLAMAADVIPLVGDWLSENISSCLIPAVALVISTPVSLFVIALGWLWYRPHLAWPLVAVGLLLAVVLGWWVKTKVGNQNGNKADAPSNGKLEMAPAGNEMETPSGVPAHNEVKIVEAEEAPAVFVPEFPQKVEAEPVSAIPVAKQEPEVATKNNEYES